MRFPYRKIPLPEISPFFGRSVLKPVIPVKLLSKSKVLIYEALIDSGADFSIFEASVGEYLGLSIREGQREVFGGIHGGRLTVFLHKLDIEVGGWLHHTTVGFSYDIAKHGYGILGQKGFFDLFAVTFDYKKETIEIKTKSSKN